MLLRIAEMHYYQFNIGDYVSHTRHLSPIEDIAYRRLLDAYYLQERPLNSGSAVVARQIGMREYEKEVALVLEEFFTLGPNGWTNGRADKEIKHFHSKIEQASRAGKASAERRSNARSTDVQPTNNQEPITNNQEPDTEEANASRPRQAGTPSAPIDEIVSLYNEKLPMLPRVTVVNDSRKRAISARWREVVTADKLDRQGGLDFFAWYFGMVSQSKFLTGKAKDWKADIDFLFNPSKFPRVIEGFYHKEQ
jgi:uncharacterized protein YdaU (DUF1376 family)